MPKESRVIYEVVTSIILKGNVEMYDNCHVIEFRWPLVNYITSYKTLEIDLDIFRHENIQKYMWSHRNGVPRLNPTGEKLR